MEISLFAPEKTAQAGYIWHEVIATKGTRLYLQLTLMAQAVFTACSVPRLTTDIKEPNRGIYSQASSMAKISWFLSKRELTAVC
jgi:hypothetical protein